MLGQTIAAVSTPRGKGGVAMIRISGPETLRVTDGCFRTKNGTPAAGREARRACYGEIFSREGVLDSGICTVYRAPASYTGEDMAELCCHGGVCQTEAVLAAVFAAGAEPAGPGEFTRRSFAAGKLTLSEAEAVGRLIDADTESRRRLAAAASRGALSARLGALGDRLAAMLAALWAAIDYPDEDVGEEGLRSLGETVRETEAGVCALLDSYRTGRAVMTGIRTVICGRPNVGKSALYNALCGQQRAIVTAVAGTTRDVLEDTVDCAGITLRLCDTAGLRHTTDEVEQIGIARAQDAIRDAELLLAVVDGSAPLSPEDREEFAAIRALSPEAAVIGVLSKADLPAAGDDAADWLHSVCDRVVTVAALREDGIESLRAAVAELWRADLAATPDCAVVFDARQKASLERAAAILGEIRDALAAGAPADALGVLCEAALAELRRTDGRGVSEEIISEIFSRFCVGK